MFQNKTLAIIGGTGYLGSYIANKAILLGANVICVGRYGKPNPKKYFYNNKITWYRGNCSDPESLAPIFDKVDAVVHSVGTLVDSTILKRAKPGEPGSYEQINRDFAINVGNLMEKQSKKKNLVYISADGHPPFLGRYLETKETAEEYLLSLSNVNTCVLKPGFIYPQTGWRHYLSYNVDFWHSFYPKVLRFIPKQTYLESFAKEFQVAKPVSIEAVAISALAGAFTNKLAQNRVLYQQMKELEADFIIFKDFL